MARCVGSNPSTAVSETLNSPRLSTLLCSQPGTATSAADAENNVEMVTADDDEVQMEVDTAAGGAIEEDVTATTSDNTLSGDIELSTVDPELRLDNADGDDWLTSLLKYDDQSSNCTNNTS